MGIVTNVGQQFIEKRLREARMDPNANLEEQRRLAAELLPYGDVDEVEVEVLEEISNKAVRLAELAQALDEWRMSGGFDPYLSSRAPVFLVLWDHEEQPLGHGNDIRKADLILGISGEGDVSVLKYRHADPNQVEIIERLP